jgi:AcrR family transcriptional regulator
MARTLNPAAHAVRRDNFVDAAQRLIQTRGYEQLSVQDLLDELDASKGAFYHYFDSKQALLEAVVEKIVDVVADSLTPMAMSPEMTGPQKLDALFAGIAQWKGARTDLMLEIARVWLSDDNITVREKVRCGVTARLTPLLAVIVRQGTAEGAFTASSPDHAAEVLVGLVLDLNLKATELYLARQSGAVTFDDVLLTVSAYTEAFERILGAAPSSFTQPDLTTLRLWFG